jgi:Fe-S-cluster containining protein
VATLMGQAISAQTDNPREWLAAYFQIRAHLAASASDFQCPPACLRPGCKNQDLQVPVNLIDLLGAAMHRNEAVSASYRRHYALGLLTNGRDDWLRLVSVRLQKPCPYLQGEHCSIYPVRPLPCVLFPENLVVEGTFAAQAREDHFRDYHCLRQPLRLSAARVQVMAKLRRMWERENLVSSFFLFQHGSCYIDFSNLTRELLDEAPEVEPGAARIIPNQVLERFFAAHLAGYQPFLGITAKIGQLDEPPGQARLLRLLQDAPLVAKLMQNRDDRALVFRLVWGRLKAKRRSMTSPACKFFG